ncbi:leucyl/phenylalanyl-tRNA--protein transferase [Kitasatospora sp. NPDC059571]|uniref:leucyl/phenylalanyl-tRNA--protein transferase n=1 Tax=Kitasatospora sp. NPDC059571 TaxID=3346871 RepID=UPI0036B62FF3
MNGADPAAWWSGVDLADAVPDGPAAFCADLGPAGLLAGYRAGAFPMPAADDYAMYLNEARYEDLVAAGAVALDDPLGDGSGYRVAWWSPDPRPVIAVGEARLGSRLARRLRGRTNWTTTADRAFDEVVRRCAEGRRPVWLTEELRRGLAALHTAGRAHSAEVWEDGTLVGGVFGVRVGPVLSLDSMFRLRPDAARIAVVDLARRFAETGGRLLDAQWDGPHVRSLGATAMPRTRYLRLLHEGGDSRPPPGDERPVRLLGAALL